MDVRIFWVLAMKCMCAQTRPWFILSSERVFGGMEFEPMLTPREKFPVPENSPRGGSNPRRFGQRAQTLPMSYSSPLCVSSDFIVRCQLVIFRRFLPEEFPSMTCAVGSKSQCIWMILFFKTCRGFVLLCLFFQSNQMEDWKFLLPLLTAV